MERTEREELTKNEMWETVIKLMEQLKDMAGFPLPEPEKRNSINFTQDENFLKDYYKEETKESKKSSSLFQAKMNEIEAFAFNCALDATHRITIRSMCHDLYNLGFAEGRHAHLKEEAHNRLWQ